MYSFLPNSLKSHPHPGLTVFHTDMTTQVRVRNFEGWSQVLGHVSTFRNTVTNRSDVRVIHLHIHAFTCGQIFVSTYARAYVFDTRVYTCTYIYIPEYIHIYVYARTHTMSIHIGIYVHTYIYYIQVHSSMYIWVCVCVSYSASFHSTVNIPHTHCKKKM